MPLPNKHQRENAAIRAFGCFGRVFVWVMNTFIVIVLSFVFYFVIAVPLALVGIEFSSWLVYYVPALIIAIGVVYVFDVVENVLIGSLFGEDEQEQERREND